MSTPRQQLALLELDGADAAAERAPTLETRLACESEPANVVTPVVQPETAGFVHDLARFVSARVTLSIVESSHELPFNGTGRPRPTGGGGVVCSNAACTQLFLVPLTAAALRQGVPAFVKSQTAGTVTVRLELTPSDDPRRVVVPSHEADVTMRQSNVVSPKVRVELSPGYEGAVAAKVMLSIDESTGDPPYTGTGTVNAGADVQTVFRDEGFQDGLSTVSAAELRKGFPAYVMAAAAKSVAVRLSLSDPADASVVVKPEHSASVAIHPLNVVKPLIALSDANGAFHAERVHPACVKLHIGQSTGNPPFDGTGTATITSGEGALYSDAGCETPLPQLTAKQLRTGTPAYVKGGGLGDVCVQLELVTANPLIRVEKEVIAMTHFTPFNVVRATVAVEVAEGLHDAGGGPGRRASVRLGIEESNRGVPYQGTVSLEVVSEVVVKGKEASLFSDEACKNKLGTPTLPQLRKGVLCYIKGGAPGEVDVQLKLGASANSRVMLATPSATGRVRFHPVNVITPVLEGDELVLVHDGLDGAFATTLSPLKLRFEQSHPDRGAPPDLAMALTYGAEIACFDDTPQALAIASGATLTSARVGASFPFRARGRSAGDCRIALAAQGTPGADWRLAKVSRTVRVEKLVLDAYEYKDALHEDDPEGDLMTQSIPGKSRELQQRDGDIFPLACLVIRQPSAAFWQKATSVTFASHGQVLLYEDEAGTIPLTAFKEEDFPGSDLLIWAATTGSPTGLTPGPGDDPIDWPRWTAHATEKEIVSHRVSCGASAVTGTALRCGDVVKLDTYSHDRTLDRLLRNACGRRVRARPVTELDQHAALSRTQAHKHYDLASQFWVNHHYRTDFTSPFNSFLNAIAKVDVRSTPAQRGADFVERHLQQNFDIALHSTLKGLIRTHIADVLRGGWSRDDDFGFRHLHGLPGAHAECLAANELLNAGIAPADITVATYMLQDQAERQGKRFVACSNCSGILRGAFRVITG